MISNPKPLEVDVGTDRRLRFLCPDDKSAFRVHTLRTKEPDTYSWITGFKPGSVFWDIGASNGIYSLLAAQVHGWQCTGTEIDPVALKNLAAVLDKNEVLKHMIDLRLQRDKRKIFEGVIKPGERFDLSVCNPPFHASQKEAMRSNLRKVNSLAFNRGDKRSAKVQPALNFGGQKNELWCEGGESGFLQTMVNESAMFARQCKWFTTLISKAENVAPAKRLIRNVGARDILEVEMEQGNKTTRIVAWTF